jgi:hypothetical protein
MAWLRWQQYRADRAEARSIRQFLERRDGYRQLCEVIVEAQRSADARSRLELTLQRYR